MAILNSLYKEIEAQGFIIFGKNTKEVRVENNNVLYIDITFFSESVKKVKGTISFAGELEQFLKLKPTKNLKLIDNYRFETYINSMISKDFVFYIDINNYLTYASKIEEIYCA
jgi:hypothetical protein